MSPAVPVYVIETEVHLKVRREINSAADVERIFTGRIASARIAGEEFIVDARRESSVAMRLEVQNWLMCKDDFELDVIVRDKAADKIYRLVNVRPFEGCERPDPRGLDLTMVFAYTSIIDQTIEASPIERLKHLAVTPAINKNAAAMAAKHFENKMSNAEFVKMYARQDLHASMCTWVIFLPQALTPETLGYTIDLLVEKGWPVKSLSGNTGIHDPLTHGPQVPYSFIKLVVDLSAW